MLEQPGTPILIVGGGIGGLAAALAFARKGLRVRILEQADAFGEVGAGIQLGPNVFRMFDILGLTETVSRYAVFPENLIMLDAITDQEVTRIPLGAGFRSKFKHPYALIYRPDLLNVLLEACRRLPAPPRHEPRALNTRTTSPSLIPRRAASAG